MRRIVLAALALALAGPAAAKDCDPACLAATTQAVLAAFQAGVPGKVLNRARITENGRDIRIADSQLHAIGALRYTQAFAEPAAGAVGVHGAAEAAGGPEIFWLRLKLKGDRVTEAETVVVRRGEATLFSPRTMAANPASDQVLAAERRTPRDAMIAAANGYLDAMAGSGANVPAAPGCTRHENGVATTGGCDGPPGGARVERVRERRVPLVDEARGLVWALALVDIPGAPYPTSLDGRAQGLRRDPRSALVGALFKLEAGEIRDIEVVMRDVPAGATTGWAPKPSKAKR